MYAEIAAQITQYTDRPDLLLKVLEENDPGFIKKMNETALAYSQRTRKKRFDFGKRQAYTALVIQVVAAITILSALILLISLNKLTFGTAIGLALFYAITQSGIKGFIGIADACREMVKRFKGTSDKSD